MFFRRALSRSETRGALFGRVLDCSLPPQPVLTMLEFLLCNGTKVEGIFRKSPKQSSVRALRAKMDQGQVPDFALYSPVVVASLLKVP